MLLPALPIMWACLAAQSGDVEDLNALAVALEIASAYEQLQESCATFKSAARSSGEQQHSDSGQSLSPFMSTNQNAQYIMLVSVACTTESNKRHCHMRLSALHRKG